MYGCWFLSTLKYVSLLFCFFRPQKKNSVMWTPMDKSLNVKGQDKTSKKTLPTLWNIFTKIDKYEDGVERVA